MSLHSRLPSLLALAVLLLSACGPTVVYEEEVTFEEGHWSYADSVVFSYAIEDTSLAYDLSLSLKHKDTYATQNLYARFVTHYPNGTLQSEVVNLTLADRFGRWLGDCAGADCALSIPIQEGARYPEPGVYGLTLHQYGRKDTLQGIQGFALEVAHGRD